MSDDDNIKVLLIILGLLSFCKLNEQLEKEKKIPIKTIQIIEKPIEVITSPTIQPVPLPVSNPISDVFSVNNISKTILSIIIGRLLALGFTNRRYIFNTIRRRLINSIFSTNEYIDSDEYVDLDTAWKNVKNDKIIELEQLKVKIRELEEKNIDVEGIKLKNRQLKEFKRQKLLELEDLNRKITNLQNEKDLLKDELIKKSNEENENRKRTQEEQNLLTEGLTKNILASNIESQRFLIDAVNKLGSDITQNKEIQKLQEALKLKNEIIEDKLNTLNKNINYVISELRRIEEAIKRNEQQILNPQVQQSETSIITLKSSANQLQQQIVQIDSITRNVPTNAPILTPQYLPFSRSGNSVGTYFTNIGSHIRYLIPKPVRSALSIKSREEVFQDQLRDRFIKIQEEYNKQKEQEVPTDEPTIKPTEKPLPRVFPEYIPPQQTQPPIKNPIIISSSTLQFLPPEQYIPRYKKTQEPKEQEEYNVKVSSQIEEDEKGKEEKTEEDIKIEEEQEKIKRQEEERSYIEEIIYESNMMLKDIKQEQKRLILILDVEGDSLTEKEADLIIAELYRLIDVDNQRMDLFEDLQLYVKQKESPILQQTQQPAEQTMEEPKILIEQKTSDIIFEQIPINQLEEIYKNNLSIIELSSESLLNEAYMIKIKSVLDEQFTITNISEQAIQEYNDFISSFNITDPEIKKKIKLKIDLFYNYLFSKLTNISLQIIDNFKKGKFTYYDIENYNAEFKKEFNKKIEQFIYSMLKISNEINPNNLNAYLTTVFKVNIIKNIKEIFKTYYENLDDAINIAIQYNTPDSIKQLFNNIIKSINDEKNKSIVYINNILNESQDIPFSKERLIYIRNYLLKNPNEELQEAFNNLIYFNDLIIIIENMQKDENIKNIYIKIAKYNAAISRLLRIKKKIKRGQKEVIYDIKKKDLIKYLKDYNELVEDPDINLFIRLNSKFINISTIYDLFINRK